MLMPVAILISDEAIWTRLTKYLLSSLINYELEISRNPNRVEEAER